MNYGAEVTSARVDYDINTDMTVAQCADNGQCGRIVVLQGNWGATGWKAYAHPFNNLTECVTYPGTTSNGNCDWWFRRANFGYVYMNDNYGIYSSAFANLLVRHEIGHIFGLAHVPCTTWSVMVTEDCGSGPGQLTTHDINDINSYY